MRVIWSPSALREIEHIYRYIAQFNPRAAENMVMDINWRRATAWKAFYTGAALFLALGCVRRRSPAPTSSDIGSILTAW